MSTFNLRTLGLVGPIALMGAITACTTMAGGGQGECQMPSGQTIDATFANS